jgi:hypothetical protein
MKSVKKTFSVLLFSAILLSVLDLNAQMPADLQGQAVATCYSGDNGSGTMDGYVIGVVDIHNPSSTGSNLMPPMFHPNNWKASRLGQVFGVAIDKRNNIYTTASTSYSAFDYTNQPLAFGSAGPGGIYKLDGVTGAVSDFVTSVPYSTSNVIGTSNLPNGVSAGTGPGLGNICYDEVHDKLFVSNFEDGKIYRINPITSKIDGVYDPVASANPAGTSNSAMFVDNGFSGFAPLGERVWAVAYNFYENRLYYSVWVEDRRTGSTAAKKNIIRSVALNSSGDFIPSTDKTEVAIDDYNGSWSSPVSDIAFSKGGAVYSSMLVGSRGMWSDVVATAHFAKTVQYKGSSFTGYSPDVQYTVGSFSNGRNSAGGVDYGYLTYNADGSNDDCDQRVWMTGDYLIFDPNFGAVYGLQSSPVAGNAGNHQAVGHFIDLNGVSGSLDKTEIGDVEVFRNCNNPCDIVNEFVKNGSLEDGGIPELRGDFQSVTFDWFAVAGDPDIFDSRFASCLPSPIPPNTPPCGLSPLDINCIGIPCNHFGFQNHRLTGTSTQRYAGLYSLGVFDKSEQLPRSKYLDYLELLEGFLIEGIGTELTQPMDTATTYNISFFVSKAEKGEVANILNDDEAFFKIKLSTEPAEIGLAGALPFTPTDAEEFYYGSVKDTAGWKLISFNIKPTKSYKYLIIESTYPIDIYQKIIDVISTDFNPDDTASGPLSDVVGLTQLESYFYIDDISVRETCTVIDSVTADAGVDISMCGAGINNVILGGAPTAINGTAPYQYLWAGVSGSYGVINNIDDANPVVSPRTTSVYKVTVTDANGKSDVDFVTVIVDSDFKVDAGPDVLQCDNNCVNIGGNPTVENGSGSYSYNWIPSLYVSGSTTISNPQVCIPWGSVDYNVEVIDNISGCKVNDHVKVTRENLGYEYVPNGGFAANNLSGQGAPIERGQLQSHSSEWLTATGTPDLFDREMICGLRCLPFDNVGVPNNYFGFQSHRTNNSIERYAGIWIAKVDYVEDLLDYPDGIPRITLYDELRNRLMEINEDLSSNVVEGIEVKLSKTLLEDQLYTVTYYASIADKGELSAVVADDVILSVKMSEVFQSSDNFLPTGGVEIIENKITSHGSWQQVQFTFRAKRDYKYLIIETKNLIGGQEAYVYVDDVSVKRTCGNAVVSTHSIAYRQPFNANSYQAGVSAKEIEVTLFPTPTKGDITLEFNYQVSNVNILILDLTGKKLKEINKEFEQSKQIVVETSDLSNGTYIIKIETELGISFKQFMVLKE